VVSSQLVADANRRFLPDASFVELD
jgi:hypothetical protein